MKTLRCLTLLINTGLAIHLAGWRTQLLQQHFAEMSVPRVNNPTILRFNGGTNDQCLLFNKAQDADATEIDYNGASRFLRVKALRGKVS